MFGMASICESSYTDCALSVTGPYESTAIVTGPIPRKPNATKPNANTAEAASYANEAAAGSPPPIGVAMFATLSKCVRPAVVEMPYAAAIRPAIVRPIQYAEKLPAVRPARILSDGPPSFDAVTTSRTWPELTEVNTLTSSGMIAPASVPHDTIADSFHHRPSGNVASAPWPISKYDTPNVRPTEISDVSHTSWVSGCSKSILSAVA